MSFPVNLLGRIALVYVWYDKKEPETLTIFSFNSKEDFVEKLEASKVTFPNKIIDQLEIMVTKECLSANFNVWNLIQKDVQELNIKIDINFQDVDAKPADWSIKTFLNSIETTTPPKDHIINHVIAVRDPNSPIGGKFVGGFVIQSDIESDEFWEYVKSYLYKIEQRDSFDVDMVSFPSTEVFIPYTPEFVAKQINLKTRQIINLD